MNQIETKVGIEIEERLDRLNELKPTDEEYRATADVTLKFIDRETKLRELELRAEEIALKQKELNEAGKRRWTDVGLKIVENALKYGVPAALAVGLTVYERTDAPVGTATKEFWKKVFKLM